MKKSPQPNCAVIRSFEYVAPAEKITSFTDN